MPLELTNLPLTGLQVEQRGVFEAGANVGSGNSDIFLFPPRGTSGSLEEGDLTLETTEITRVRVQGNGALLSLSDSNQPDALNLSSYFGASGAGRDLTLYFVTALGMFSIPVENDDGTDGYDAAFGNTVRFNILDTTLDPGSGFGFDNAGVGFDQSRFLPNPYNAQDVLRGIRNGDRFIIAFARPIPRRAVTAAGTFGAGSATVDVLTRAPTRHETEASRTFAVVSFARPSVAQRMSTRHTVTASATFAALSSTASVDTSPPVRKAITTSLTFAASVFARPSVAQRTPDREAVTASKTLGAMSAIVSVDIRESPRKLITTSLTFQAMATTASLDTRPPIRTQITAALTFLATSSTASFDTRQPLRNQIMAALTFPAMAATASIDMRQPSRKQLTAAMTFPAMSATTTVVKRERPLAV